MGNLGKDFGVEKIVVGRKKMRGISVNIL